MKIILPGGSGQVGSLLARTFHADGHEVVVLSRKKTQCPWRVREWDGKTTGAWAEEFEGADVVINLAGRSVNCRYNAENRRAILNSRVDSTRVVGLAIARAQRPPRVWLQASTATIYSHRFDSPNDDMTGLIGGTEQGVPETWRFSIEVAQAWEKTAQAAATPHTRLALLRSAMTLSPDRGGIFDVLLGLVQKGLGGAAGDGRQYISWIHERDFIRAIYWLIENEEASGHFNLAAPQPIPNHLFMQELRTAWGIPFGLPASPLILEIGALLMQTETELILKSRRVIPVRLTKGGFTFVFPEWRAAARDLCQAWRQLN
jgi:uncharacterized protein